MSLAVCAALVERADPVRFRATMAAPPEARENLWPLYAYNIEIARAPWVSAEAAIGAMRLTWWEAAVSDFGSGPAPVHEVAGPLADLVARRGLPVALLAEMAEARQADLEAKPFADRAALQSYLDRTAGNLMWLAALALGAPPGTEPTVRDFANASGLAAYLCAAPELIARGRVPLPDGGAEFIAGIAREGLGRLAKARRAGVPVAVLPALWPGSEAGAILRRARHQPERVAEGRLERAEFLRRGVLLWKVARRRF